MHLMIYVAPTTSLTRLPVSLHWLRVPERIQFKIAMLAHEVLTGTAPRYLGPLVRVSHLSGRRFFPLCQHAASY